MVQLLCQPPEARRQQRLQPLAQRRREARRDAAGADRDQHRRAVDDRRRGEVAKRRPVDRIDQDAARLQPIDRGERILLVLDRHHRERSGGLLADDHRPRPLEQAALGIGRLALAEQDHRPPRQPDEQRQAVKRHPSPFATLSHAGTRSAARIVSAAMRSATTA